MVDGPKIVQVAIAETVPRLQTSFTVFENLLRDRFIGNADLCVKNGQDIVSIRHKIVVRYNFSIILLPLVPN